MAKFKVGQMVEDFERGTGVVKHIDNDEYPVSVEFESGLTDEYTVEGKRWQKTSPVLRLTGRPFNVGDRVVIGREKGEITSTTTGVINPLKVTTDNGFTYLTTDGRAWPGTPIICEHDWHEEGKTVVEKAEKGINALGEAAAAVFGMYGNDLHRVAEVQEQKVIAEKNEELSKEIDEFEKNCGALGDWPVGDVTVSPEEVRHIAEIQEQQNTESELMPKYIKMALALEGIEVDLKTADLIREIVDSVNAHGGLYNIDTSCNIRQKIEQKYNEANI